MKNLTSANADIQSALSNYLTNADSRKNKGLSTATHSSQLSKGFKVKDGKLVIQ